MIYEVYVDGGCRPNPGKMEIGIVIPKLNIKLFKDDIGEGTSNRAEYIALIYALELIKNLTEDTILIYVDSQLVHGQMIKQWKVNKNEDLYDKAMSLFDSNYEKIIKIPRNYNKAGWLLESRK